MSSPSIIHAANAVCERMGVKPANVGSMAGQSKHPRYGTWGQVRAMVFTELRGMGFWPRQITFVFGVTQYQTDTALRIGQALKQRQEGT